MSSPTPLIEMTGITRRFPGVVANRDACLTVHRGSVHAIIGENGAGKSTLVNVLYGQIRPDRGTIRLDGREVRIASPLDAIRLGIGMVTQHTTLIPALTILENIVLGAEPSRLGIIRADAAVQRVTAICDSMGVRLPLSAPASDVSVSTLQKAEIVKALYRGARILILDEPTAMLSAEESEALFMLVHSLAETGGTILLITHKLREVMEHADRVTVLRAGKTVAEVETGEVDAEALVARIMGTAHTPLGDDAGSFEGEWPEAPSRPWVAESPDPILALKGVTARGRRQHLRDITLTVMPGEIVGVAGVDGSGQQELAEAIVGLLPVSAGSIAFDGEEITRTSVAARIRKGIAFIPEDRQHAGLILDFTVAENLLLGRQRDRSYGGGRFLRSREIESEGARALQEGRIVAAGPSARTGSLSGGNQQKVVIARALMGQPRLLVAMQPGRGLDVESSRHALRQLQAATRKGMGALYFSLDLDEIREVSDRIAILFDGRLAAVLARDEATPDVVGRLMVGAQT